MLRFNLHEELAPVLVQITERGSSFQRDKLLSLLMTALEDVKTTHLEQIFRVFHVLLDFEEQAVKSEVGVPSVIEKVPVHQHLFSASKGILEAAEYYKDHPILHEYTSQLLEFCVSRAKGSLLLQQLFKLDEDLHDQVSWISSWLVKYLDPTGSIRLQRHGRKPAADEAERKQIGFDPNEEDADNEIIVNALFESIEKSFGCSVFPNKEPSALQGEKPRSSSQDELPGYEDSKLSDVNQNGGDNHSAMSLEDIVPEFGEARNSKAATSNTSKLTIVVSDQGPETEDDNNDHDHDHDHDSNNRERSPRMDDKKYSVEPKYTPLQALQAPSTRAFAMRDLMYSHRSNEA